MTMKRLMSLVLGIAVGGAGVYMGMKNHFVRTQDGVVMVPKIETSLTDTYVDLRNFGVEDWAQHKELVEALVAAKKENLLGRAAEGSLGNSVSRLIRYDTK